MLDSPPGGPDAPVPPRIKRQIFKNRPAWGTPDSSNVASRANDNTDDFFSRSNETLSNYDFGQDEKSRKKKKRSSTPPRERDKTPADNEEDTARQSVSKRRRLSESDDDYQELYASARAGGGSPRTGSKSDKPPNGPDTRKRNHVETKQRHKERPKMVVVELSDDENINGGTDPPRSSSPTPAPRSSSTSPMPSIEDPAAPTEHNHVRHKKPSPAKELAVANHRSSSTPVEILDKAPSPAPAPQSPPSQPVPPASPAPDPVLNILIHSRLPNTSPLIAQRKFSQRLREIRLAWCARQGLTPAQTSAVFLAWRGRRVFDFTTFRSLGIHVSSLGDVSIRGQVLPPGEDGAQIEMEAVTAELWEEMQREREGRGRAGRSEEPAEGGARAAGEDEDAAEGAAAVAAAASAEQPIRIILRSRDYGEYKLVVKTTTKFFRIADAYRRHGRIPPDKEVLLMFEGEKLEPSEEMKDSDIGELDYVDVYVK